MDARKIIWEFLWEFLGAMLVFSPLILLMLGLVAKCVLEPFIGEDLVWVVVVFMLVVIFITGLGLLRLVLIKIEPESKRKEEIT